ncbi:MAG TPA: hypothetical protein VGL64_03195 [Amycolatopsis sp.]|jgi:hypothetical protein
MVQYTLVAGGLPLAGAPAYLAFLLHRRRWGLGRPPLSAEELRAVADVLPRTRPVLPPAVPCPPPADDDPGPVPAELCVPCLSRQAPVVPAPRRPESAPRERARAG